MMETVYTVKTKNITLKSLTDKINLVFFGDIHRFTKSCDEDRWKYFLRKAKEKHTPNTYYIGLGDYMDFASSKEQKAILNGNIHSQTIEDFGDLVKKRNRALSMEMSFMKGHVLGFIDGNHNWRFSNGTTATQDLAERMNTEYLGWLCHYALIISFDYGNSYKGHNIYMSMCHGKAGGKTRGNSINQMNDLWNIFPASDIYAMGHDHQRFTVPSSVLLPYTNRKTGEVTIKQKRQFFVRGGSFKRAFVPDTASYEVGRLLRPSDLGATFLEVGFHTDTTDGDRIITDITGTV